MVTCQYSQFLFFISQYWKTAIVNTVCFFKAKIFVCLKWIQVRPSAEYHLHLGLKGMYSKLFQTYFTLLRYGIFFYLQECAFNCICSMGGVGVGAGKNNFSQYVLILSFKSTWSLIHLTPTIYLPINLSA